MVCSQIFRPSVASIPHDTSALDLKTIEDVDNKHVRQNVREWITSNVPHNKQPEVRSAIFDTLWALVPASTRTKMHHAEEAYDLGKKTPPGGDVADSDHGGEVNNDILREPRSRSPGASPTGQDHVSKKCKTSPSHSKKTKDGPKKKENLLPDLTSVHIDGESGHAVPIYETCDMIRHKIDAFLRQTGFSNAAFCRTVAEAMLISVSGTQLSSFRSRKGYDSGNTSNAFYACYVFFEKLRIKEGNAKSKDRLKMEELWTKKGGFNVEKAGHNKALTMMQGERYTINK